MADHINIHHPGPREERMRRAIEIAELKARIATMEGYMLDMEGDLGAIFTRIQRGDNVELHYPDGTVINMFGEVRAHG